MIRSRSIEAIIVSSLIIIGASGVETNSVAQPTPTVSKKIPTGHVPTKPEFVEGEVLVKYTERFLTKEPIQRARKIKEAGELLKSEFHIAVLRTHVDLGIQRLKLPADETVSTAIKNFSRLRIVEFVEPNYRIYPQQVYSAPPNDTHWLDGKLWGMNQIGMQFAWNQSASIQANNVIIAVLDSGIEKNHTELTPHLWQNLQEYNASAGQPNGADEDNNGIYDDMYGASFCTYPTGALMSGNNSDNLLNPHGTLVAGVIGALVGNGLNVAGVHREARLMALKVLCHSNNSGTVDDAVTAINYAVSHGATIINMSWAVASGGSEISDRSDAQSPGGPSNSLRTAIQNAGSALFVAAAGNSVWSMSGPDLRNNDAFPVYPANYGAEGLNNVIAVAATTVCAPDDFGWPHNGTCSNGVPYHETFWEQSHYGQTTVHIAAPGDNIWSTALDPSTTASIALAFSGTSAATPHVAGCAALLQSMRGAISPSSLFSPHSLRELLMNSGDPITGLSVVSGKRLNCARAMSEWVPSDMVPPRAPSGLEVH